MKSVSMLKMIKLFKEDLLCLKEGIKEKETLGKVSQVVFHIILYNFM
jgi:hypothetical protein